MSESAAQTLEQARETATWLRCLAITHSSGREKFRRMAGAIESLIEIGELTAGLSAATVICAECGERFTEDETPVPSRSIVGAPLVHEECA